MTTPTAPCDQNVTIATLSDWRDAPAPAGALSDHIATCPACRARVAGFDLVAQVLRRQRELEPDRAIWLGVQARFARREQTMKFLTRKPIAGSLIGALCVIVIAVLFAQLLHNRPGGAHPLSVVTATATYAVKPTPEPTATPISVANVPTASQAWGVHSALASLTLGNFQVGGMTPDGKRLLGFRLAADRKNYDVGWLDVATQQITIFDESPVNGPDKSNTPPTCCITDGRFYVGSNGIPEGASAYAPFSYDTVTGQLHLINSPQIGFRFIHAGVAYYDGANGLIGLNLLTGATKSAPGTAAFANFTGYSWPYLAYTAFTNQGKTVMHAHNLATGADVALDQLGDVTNTVDSSTLDGDTLIYLLSQGSPLHAAQQGLSLVEMDHIMSPTSQPVTLTPMPGASAQDLLANQRIVAAAVIDYACATNACVYAFAWDRALHTLVLLSPTKAAQVIMQGNYLAVIDQTTQRVTLYDTAMLPTQYGG